MPEEIDNSFNSDNSGGEGATDASAADSGALSNDGGEAPNSGATDPNSGATAETETKPKEEPKKDPMGPRFAALAKREKALVDRDTELKTKEADLTKREAEVKRWTKVQEAFAKDDYDGVLSELGVDDDGFTKLMKGLTAITLRKKDLPPEVLEMNRKLRALEEERAAERRAAEETKKKQEEEAKTAGQRQAETNKRAFKTQTITPFVKADADKYEVLNYALSMGDAAEERVLGEIYDKVDAEFERASKADGFDPQSFDLQKALAEAADSVETELATLYGGELTKLSGLKKFQPKQQPKPVEEQTVAEVRASARKQILEGQTATPRPKTLTNRVQAAPPAETGDETDPQVAFQRALKMM